MFFWVSLAVAAPRVEIENGKCVYSEVPYHLSIPMQSSYKRKPEKAVAANRAALLEQIIGTKCQGRSDDECDKIQQGIAFGEVISASDKSVCVLAMVNAGLVNDPLSLQVKAQKQASELDAIAQKLVEAAGSQAVWFAPPRISGGDCMTHLTAKSKLIEFREYFQAAKLRIHSEQDSGDAILNTDITIRPDGWMVELTLDGEEESQRIGAIRIPDILIPSPDIETSPTDDYLVDPTACPHPQCLPESHMMAIGIAADSNGARQAAQDRLEDRLSSFWAQEAGKGTPPLADIADAYMLDIGEVRQVKGEYRALSCINRSEYGTRIWGELESDYDEVMTVVEQLDSAQSNWDFLQRYMGVASDAEQLRTAMAYLSYIEPSHASKSEQLHEAIGTHLPRYAELKTRQHIGLKVSSSSLSSAQKSSIANHGNDILKRQEISVMRADRLCKSRSALDLVMDVDVDAVCKSNSMTGTYSCYLQVEGHLRNCGGQYKVPIQFQTKPQASSSSESAALELCISRLDEAEWTTALMSVLP